MARLTGNEKAIAQALLPPDIFDLILAYAYSAFDIANAFRLECAAGELLTARWLAKHYRNECAKEAPKMLIELDLY